MRNCTYERLPIQGPISDFNPRYLDRQLSVMNNALEEHPRTYAARIDLRLPYSEYDLDCLSRDEIVSYNRTRTNLMKRFTDSLKAKIKTHEQRASGRGKRTYPCSLRYVWCRERNFSENDHYHLVLFFNKDRYHKLGDYRYRGSLASLIIEAWASALDYEFEDVVRLVHFPTNHGYYLNENSGDFPEQYRDLFYRISYLAKKRTKHYGEGHRCFGCSNS